MSENEFNLHLTQFSSIWVFSPTQVRSRGGLNLPALSDIVESFDKESMAALIMLDISVDFKALKSSFGFKKKAFTWVNLYFSASTHLCFSHQ